MLLLTDEVQRIVPRDAATNDPDSIKEIAQVMPVAFTDKAPETTDIDFDDLTLDRLRHAFRDIRASIGQEGKRRVSLRAHPDGSVSIDGHVFLHQSKAAPRVRALLMEEQMLLPFLQDYAADTGTGDLLPIPEPASNLILSCIADRIAAREGLDTATDVVMDYASLSMNALGVSVGKPAGSVEGALLSAIATINIPDDIGRLDIRKYAELRDSYYSIRAAFKEYVATIAITHRLGRIGDPAILADTVCSVAEKIRSECDELRRSAYARRFTEWGPFAVSSVLAVGAALADPSYGLVFAGGAVGLEFIDRVYFEKGREEQTPEACRLLADLRTHILKSADIAAMK